MYDNNFVYYLPGKTLDVRIQEKEYCCTFCDSFVLFNLYLFVEKEEEKEAFI